MSGGSNVRSNWCCYLLEPRKREDGGDLERGRTPPCCTPLNIKHPPEAGRTHLYMNLYTAYTLRVHIPIGGLACKIKYLDISDIPHRSPDFGDFFIGKTTHTACPGAAAGAGARRSN